MLKFPWLTVLKIGVPIIVVALFVWAVYSAGVKHEANARDFAETKAELAKEQEVSRLKDRIAVNEAKYRQNAQTISDQLVQLNEGYARSIAALRVDFADRMQRSEQRSAVYASMSQAGSAEQADLARHAAELDRSLEQGRLLVGELRSTVEQRDGQLRELGAQLQADRELIDGNTSPTEE